MQQFVSFAQTMEDVVLWRALKHIKNGFYIDIGAADPVHNSVTKAFYDRGWSGINVEPGKLPFSKLVSQRTRDINLNCAVGDACETRDWYSVSEDSELSTLRQDFADLHEGTGREVKKFPISVRTLTDICEKHAEYKEIHFLKIDAEGNEFPIINGMNFAKFRPWIIVVEAHDPEMSSDHWREWEEVLIKNNYIFVFLDGLNRYYVAKGMSKSVFDGLRYPACVHDNFITERQKYLEERVEKVTAEFHGAYDQSKLAWAEVERLQKILEDKR